MILKSHYDMFQWFIIGMFIFFNYIYLGYTRTPENKFSQYRRNNEITAISINIWILYVIFNSGSKWIFPLFAGIAISHYFEIRVKGYNNFLWLLMTVWILLSVIVKITL